MNLQLPPERQLPNAEETLDAILAVDPPRRVRAWWLLVVVLAIAVLAASATGWLNRERASSLATPSPTQSTPHGSATPTPSPSASQRYLPDGFGGSAGPACLVERPAEWDRLIKQYRMAEPATGTLSVGVLEAGLDGSVVTVRTADDHSRWLEYWPADGSGPQTVTEIGAQTILTDFDTDGESFLYLATMLGRPTARYLWRPGTEPVELAAPLLAPHAQQNGRSIWLTTQAQVTTLVITGPDGELRIPVADAIDLATQNEIVWVLFADGTITGFDLTSGEQRAHPHTGILTEPDFERPARPVESLFSDGRRLGMLRSSFLTVMTTTKGDHRQLYWDATADDTMWSVSDDFVTWLEGSWPDAQYRIWDMRTRAVATLPAPGGKSEAITGVRNGHLIVHADPLRPSVIPLAQLGILHNTCPLRSSESPAR